MCPMSESEYGADDAGAARLAILAHLDEGRPQGMFGWPLDVFGHEWWGYQVHVSAVGAWNVEGRKTPYALFLRSWLDSPGFAEAWDRAVDWALRSDTSPAHSHIRVEASNDVG